MTIAMKFQTYIIAFAASLVSTAVLAWQTPVGPAPTPAFIDMERTTNAPITTAMLQHARVFECSVSLLANPSNAVEVAFGTSRNGDGVLHHGDETFAIGWEGGAWFVASATNRICSVQQEGAALRSLFFALHLSEDGAPRSLSLTATGTETAFPSLIASPPPWMFSREWNAVRLTVRGVGEADESASIRFGPNPVFIILR
jgi:hypothetical protein